MTVCLPIRFSERSELSPEETSAVKALAAACKAADCFDPCLNFDTNLNVVPGIPAWRLAWAESAAGPRLCSGPPGLEVEASGKGILAGAASFFAPGTAEAEISACVSPVFRHQGIFSSLFNGLAAPLKAHGFPSIVLVAESAAPLGAAIAAHLGACLSRSEYQMRLEPEQIVKRTGTSGVRLIPVTTDTVDTMVRLSTECFGETEDDARSFTLNMLQDPSREMFVARNDSGPVGTVALARDAEGYMIHGLGVLPGSRRQGLGGAILDCAISVLAGRAARSVRLEVDSDNETARSLYLSRGFVDSSRVDYWQIPMESR
jgi:ribosomal protein S18 acetylase RimI-like enzyme